MSTIRHIETQESVLATVTRLIRSIVDEGGDPGSDDVLDLEIGMRSRLSDDLMLESIDLVTLSEKLALTYGDRVNIAEFLIDMDLDEAIGLTVGRLVEYVIRCLDVDGKR